VTDQTLEQKAVEIITNIEKLAEPAMQLTLQAMQAAAVINVALDIVFLGVMFLVWRFVFKVIYPLWRETNSEVFEIGGVCALVIGGGVTLVGACACMFTLFSASTWLSIFAPELQLARMLIEKAV
jgi:hypothetical protein